MQKTIRVAMIGMGERGKQLMEPLLKMEDVQVVAVCDAYEDRTKAAAEAVKKENGNIPFQSQDYKAVLSRDDVDVAVISTSWQYHIAIAIEAMRRGVFAAMEVGGTYNLQECYDLVEAYEQTKTPFFFLENCCYGRRELMCLNMARAGEFGEIVHCDGAYKHDLRKEVSYGKENRHYRLPHYIHHNCENYPTHELGPIAKILGINRGNRMLRLVSVASKARGLARYVRDNKPDDTELLNTEFRQGDIVTTVITCENGETITAILPVPEEDMAAAAASGKEHYLMFATASGTVRRNRTSDFDSIRANGKIAMKLDDGDSLISVLPCTDDQDVFLATYRGRCIRFPVTEIRVFAGRNSTGVRGMTLGADDKIIGMAMLNHGESDASIRAAYIKQSRAARRAATGIEEEASDDEEDATTVTLTDDQMAKMAASEQFILTVSENGFGKRTSSYEYRTTHRGGGGFANIKLGGKNTAVAGSFPVADDNDIIMVTDGGKIIRTPVRDVRIAGRATAGVTLFRTAENERVVSAISILSDEAEESEVESEAAEQQNAQ